MLSVVRTIEQAHNPKVRGSNPLPALIIPGVMKLVDIRDLKTDPASDNAAPGESSHKILA